MYMYYAQVLSDLTRLGGSLRSTARCDAAAMHVYLVAHTYLTMFTSRYLGIFPATSYRMGLSYVTLCFTPCMTCVHIVYSLADYKIVTILPQTQSLETDKTHSSNECTSWSKSHDHATTGGVWCKAAAPLYRTYKAVCLAASNYLCLQSELCLQNIAVPV